MKPRKRFLFLSLVLIAAGSVLLGSIAVALGMRFWKYSQLIYFEQTTGLNIPAEISLLDVFDNTETFIAVHLQLKDEDIQPFLQQSGFEPTFLNSTIWMATLKPENRTFPPDASLLHREGYSQYNHWECIIDQNSGRVWLVIFYPDPGGVPPP